MFHAMLRYFGIMLLKNISVNTLHARDVQNLPNRFLLRVFFGLVCVKPISLHVLN